MPSMVRIMGHAPSVDIFCLSVTLWNYEVCDNGNAMKQCNFQNNYGAITQKELCSCAIQPPEFSLGAGQFIPKITIFRDEVWYEGADLGLPSPR